jgi:hypothetical protein
MRAHHVPIRLGQAALVTNLVQTIESCQAENRLGCVAGHVVGIFLLEGLRAVIDQSIDQAEGQLT